MKSKQILLFSILALLSTTVFFSCKKDTTYPIAGLYQGTYTVDSANTHTAIGSLYYSLDIYPDGSVITKGGDGQGGYLYATGTWTLSGSTFTANISAMDSGTPPITQSITATFSNKGTLTNGIWKDVYNPYTKNTGKYSLLQRIN